MAASRVLACSTLSSKFGGAPGLLVGSCDDGSGVRRIRSWTSSSPSVDGDVSDWTGAITIYQPNMMPNSGSPRCPMIRSCPSCEQTCQQPQKREPAMHRASNLILLLTRKAADLRPCATPPLA